MERQALENELSRMMAAMKQPELIEFNILPSLKEAIEKELGFSWKNLLDRNNRTEVADARKVAIHLLNKYTFRGMRNIAEIMNRSRWTIIYNVNTANELLESDKRFIKKVAIVEHRTFAI